MQVTFDPQPPGSFAGVNIEEPENWGVLRTGRRYDLRGAANVIVDVRSPDGATVQFGVGGCTTDFFTVPPTWTTMTIALSSLKGCTLDLSSVHILFGVATNDIHAPHGGTVLLDNIRFDPVPANQQSALSFPISNQTFGAYQQQNVPIGPDQALRNLTTIYESALTLSALVARGTPQDLALARVIADTFDYALHHDNHGDPLPVAPDGSGGLHNGYKSDDIALFNDQSPPKQGKAGDVQLAGFTATQLCSPAGFCLVLDDATGGNNAFAILALVTAYRTFHDPRYLADAQEIGNWIIAQLTDPGPGFGGYFAGYHGLDDNMPGVRNEGKSTENNADIYSAMIALATVDTAGTSKWQSAAKVAGDFVITMFDARAAASMPEQYRYRRVPGPGSTRPVHASAKILLTASISSTLTAFLGWPWRNRRPIAMQCGGRRLRLVSANSKLVFPPAVQPIPAMG